MSIDIVTLLVLGCIYVTMIAYNLGHREGKKDNDNKHYYEY